MILALRQRHRRMIIAIGILLPIAFLGGVAARRPVPLMRAVPSELEVSAPRFDSVVWERSDLFAKAPITIRLLRASTEFGIQFIAPKDFVKPDLIVYWLPGTWSGSEVIPDNAQLLGQFSSRALRLPQTAFGSYGSIILYSLADNEIVDVSKPITIQQFNDSTN